MKYNVHIFTTVRVTTKEVEANNQIQAMKIAEDKEDFYKLFEDVEDLEWTEEHTHALVDESDDPNYLKSKWYDGDLKSPLVSTNIMGILKKNQAIWPTLLGLSPELDQTIEQWMTENCLEEIVNDHKIR